jgi:hypothetical protein
MAFVHRGIFLQGQPNNLSALRQQIRQPVDKEPLRGVIVGGEKITIQTEKVEFKADPTPVMALTITYYKP